MAFSTLAECEAVASGLSDILAGKEARIILLLAGSAMLCAVGWYIVGKIRSKLRESDPGPSEFMTNFRELHSQGELSDEEYRTIKAMLASRLQSKWKDPAKEPSDKAS